ncbi:MAG: NAD-dependent epimerase/dehydratase family protein [bacterium]|nr:NAD-dependent epimerase/dehydratase family protein [bacterium]
MSRVLITGGTGFIGSHAIEAFLKSGWTVRSLVRDPGHLRWLTGLPVDIAQGAVEDDSDSLMKHLDGCDVVVHCAGLTKARCESEYFRLNADAAGNLARAARNAGVARFIYCSSQAAAGPSYADRAVHETDLPRPITAYGRSKLAGENAVREMSGGMPWIILRPPTVIGPRDRQLLPLFRAITRFGIYPEIGGEELRYSFVGVHDLTRAMLMAAEVNSGWNEIYFVANDTSLSWRETALRIAALASRRVRSLRFSRIVLKMVAVAADASSFLTGQPALLSRDKMREMLTSGWICSAEKIRRAWNFECQQSLDDVLRVTYAAYRDARWL